MDHPYYTITVASPTRGWTYSTVEGEGWDPADDAVLVSPLTYSWEFENDLVPGHLGPFQATVNILARDAQSVPSIYVGDVVTIDVRVGTTGPRIIAPPPMRVTAVTVALGDVVSDGPGDYGALLSLALADVTSDLGGLFPQPSPQTGSGIPFEQAHWRPRLGEIGVRVGYSVGCPTWWDDVEEPPTSSPFGGSGIDRTDPARAGFAWSQSARDLLTGGINSHQPSSYTHSICPAYTSTGSTYPSGYRKVLPDTTAGPWYDPDTMDPSSDPETQFKYLIVPASRRFGSSSDSLPLMFGVVDGMLTLVPSLSNPDGVGNSRIAVDAGWCHLPTQARQAREHIVDTVRIRGGERMVRGDLSPVEISSRATERVFSVSGPQPFSRDLNTWLFLGDAMDSDYTGGLTQLTANAPAVTAGLFQTDSSARGPWVYDEFDVSSEAMPDDVAEELLPRIAPRCPGETDGDGQILRHVTIYRLAPGARFAEAPVKPGSAASAPGLIGGFIVRGSMTVTGGDIVWTLTLTPGEPIPVGSTPDTLLVSEMVAAGATVTIGDTDPLITIDDLAFVAS